MTAVVLLLLLASAAVGLAYAFPAVRRELPTALFASAALVMVLAAVGVSTIDGPLPPAALWWVAIAALLAASLGGAPVVDEVLALIPPDPDRAPPSLPAFDWAGVAERFGFVLALLLGLPEVAAVLLAVQALGIVATRSHSGSAGVRVLGTLVGAGWALLCFASWWLASR
ncbi:hypothetical protein [Leifsonia sp. LS-T14]|uniref:hypothetical protein n=1 Tax=unclassified Leifsonia TaxID=2663824 RepID=UPI0035A72BB8